MGHVVLLLTSEVPRVERDGLHGLGGTALAAPSFRFKVLAVPPDAQVHTDCGEDF